MQHGNGDRRASGRDRLLATARDLFTRRGASNVGINDVTAAAGVAKMTLYNNFASKEALTLAVYGEMTQATLREVRAMATTGLSEEARVLALFDKLSGTAGKADPRGCPFIHASLQPAEPAGPIHAIVRSYKRALRDHVLGLLDDRAGRPGRADRDDLAGRAELADQIVILLDGMATQRYLEGVAHPRTAAKRAAAALLRAAGATG
ncbi:TetR/AcrR family transcriptional regulator [Sphingomonas bacterium]|uniref:TetR/AcrR family transcriptional regulator n=1 Tax=Sphingomonas bacterium TaxID=1895847 RepID=UPI001577167B|nr:TetR/AcrR family transcriptional regulator [Sphingomonas bacterium]